jgi:hypothetical protein
VDASEDASSEQFQANMSAPAKAKHLKKGDFIFTSFFFFPKTVHPIKAPANRDQNLN